MTDICLRERYENLYFHCPGAWPSLLLLAAMAIPVTEIVCRRRPKVRSCWFQPSPFARRWPRTEGPSSPADDLPGRVRRGRELQLDFQPGPHDDEYTSLQAILMIARTGVPRFVPDGVTYSRSPMYHYLAGGLSASSARTSGLSACRPYGSRWRLVCFFTDSVRLLMKRPWVGLAASALFAIHPITIFTGHMIRFYEQQSFFSLLGIYLFCRGFATGSSQKYRYLTLIVLNFAPSSSQEITAVMALQIAVGRCSARDLGWPANLRLILVGCCVVAIVGLDFLVFQIHCLTRLEGVSPNMEASIQLHFWQPYYILSIFLGYSRTHVLASLIILLAMPALIRKGDRTFCDRALVPSDGDPPE